MKKIVRNNISEHMEKGNKKKLATWTKFTIIIALVIVIAMIGTFIYVNMTLNYINHPKDFAIVPPEAEYFETDERENTINEAEGSYISETSDVNKASEANKTNDVIKTNDITWPTDGDVLQDKSTINILLIGQDRRPGESRARSDSMIITTINKKNSTIKLTSLMRDLYVQIPGYSDNRINAAYAFGGMELLDATIMKNFQIHIDGNIEVDFDGFQQVINKIGGIDITINAEEATYLERRGFTGLSEGRMHMDGSLALGYSRIRYIGNSDYERTERQKRVLTTAFNNIKDLGLTKILGLANEILPLVTTDLSKGQIISFATSVVIMGVDNVGTFRIPVDNAYTSSSIRGMSVLVPDLTANRKALKDIIYGE